MPYVTHRIRTHARARIHTSLAFLTRILLRIVKHFEIERVRPEAPQRGCVGFGGDMAANGEKGQGRVGVAGVACGHVGAEKKDVEEEGDQHDAYPPLEDQVENSCDVSLFLSLSVFSFHSLTFFLSLFLSVSLHLSLSLSLSL